MPGAENFPDARVIDGSLLASPGAHEGFRLDAQAVGDTGDVIEEGNHLGSVVDGDVVETVAAQQVEVRRCDVVLVAGQFDGVGAEGAVGRRKVGLPPVGCDVFDKGVGLFCCGEKGVDLGTEVVGVGLGSVDAAQLRGHDRRQHLPLAPAQGRSAVHNRPVKFHTGLEGTGVEGHNLNDIPDPPRPFDCFVQFGFEQTGGLLTEDLWYPRHRRLLLRAWAVLLWVE